MPGRQSHAARPCDQCVRYRPKRRLEQIFKIPTDRPSQASREIREREAQWESDESACLIELLDAGVKEWPGRPRVLAYCGLLEEDDIFLVYESKNVNHESKHADHRCDDFTPLSSVPVGFCSECVHHVKAAGPDDDRKSAEQLARISPDMRPHDSANQRFDSGWVGSGKRWTRCPRATTRRRRRRC